MAGFVLEYESKDKDVNVRVRVSAPQGTDLDRVLTTMTEALASSFVHASEYWISGSGEGSP